MYKLTEGYEANIAEALKKLWKYICKPCTDHPAQDTDTYIDKRYKCPLCMEQLDKELS